MKSDLFINKHKLHWLLVGVLFLALANVVNQIVGKPYWGITRFIYLGYDNNLSAWYSSMLFVAGAFLAHECSVLARRNNVRGEGFLLFAMLLIFMSADEVAQIHEIVGSYLAKFTGLSTMEFAQHSAWVWIGGPVIIALFVAVAILLKRELAMVPGSLKLLLIGLGMIVVGGIVLEATINFLNHETLQWLWDVEIVLEETLEMVGSIIIAYSMQVWRDGIRSWPVPKLL